MHVPAALVLLLPALHAFFWLGSGHNVTVTDAISAPTGHAKAGRSRADSAREASGRSDSDDEGTDRHGKHGGAKHGREKPMTLPFPGTTWHAMPTHAAAPRMARAMRKDGEFDLSSGNARQKVQDAQSDICKQRPLLCVPSSRRPRGGRRNRSWRRNRPPFDPVRDVNDMRLVGVKVPNHFERQRKQQASAARRYVAANQTPTSGAPYAGIPQGVPIVIQLRLPDQNPPQQPYPTGNAGAQSALGAEQGNYQMASEPMYQAPPPQNQYANGRAQQTDAQYAVQQPQGYYNSAPYVSSQHQDGQMPAFVQSQPRMPHGHHGTEHSNGQYAPQPPSMPAMAPQPATQSSANPRHWSDQHEHRVAMRHDSANERQNNRHGYAQPEVRNPSPPRPEAGPVGQMEGLVRDLHTEQKERLGHMEQAHEELLAHVRKEQRADAPRSDSAQEEREERAARSHVASFGHPQHGQNYAGLGAIAPPGTPRRTSSAD